MIRRWFDLTLSLGMVCIGLSVLPLLALLIKLDSPGPVFYAGAKLGKDGRPFRLLKLRTMTPAREVSQRQITRVGAVLRRTYLDEWPSFLNVLRGEMTLIGPRPQSPERDGQGPLTAKPGLMPALLRLHRA
ncbi:MAG: sugar transferase [Anaerolineae bacterium]|nr:sugar transferase [Anaerolineae bacterium]